MLARHSLTPGRPGQCGARACYSGVAPVTPRPALVSLRRVLVTLGRAPVSPGRSLPSLGSPKQGGQNQQRLPHPCLFRGPKEGRNATSPLHSQGSPNKGVGDKIGIGCLTPATSGAHKWAKMLHHGCILGDPQTKGDKTRSGCFSLAFSGAQKWAEMLHHPCILGDPQTKGDEIRSGCLGPAFLEAQK